jgi:putative oxidoreductase
MSHTRTLDMPARALLAPLFVVSAALKLMHWTETVARVAQHGIPFPTASLAIATAVELGGGLALLLGWGARRAAVVLLLYLIPVTLTFHAFWRETGGAAQLQLVNFFKNLALMGGLFAFARPTVERELEHARGQAPPAGEGTIGPRSEGPRNSGVSVA